MPPKAQKERQYVSVIQRVDSRGEIYPLAICWPDGRTFYIDTANCATSTYQSEFNHRDIKTYIVKTGGKSVKLYLEHQGPSAPVLARWFVLVDAGKPLWKFNLGEEGHVYGSRK